MNYTVVGVSAAGMAAVKAILKQEPEAEITVVSKDSLPYSRMMLYKLLAGEMSREQICFESPDFLKKGKIRWLEGKAVVGGDGEKKCLYLEDDSTLSYDKLLLATGAYSFIPPVPGLREAENVRGFRNMPDEEFLEEVCGEKKPVVIIGGGLVGLDVAYALCKRGVSVSVVEMAERLLPLQLDVETAAVYQKKFEDAGARFYLGRKAAQIVLEEKTATAVELDNGERLPCGAIVVSAGVRPEITLAEKLGAATQRGITVNNRMETSLPGVYAAGDATGLSGIWMSAMNQGTVAGTNMAGGTAAYTDSFSAKNMINYFGLMAMSVGNVSTPDTVQVVQRNGNKEIRLYHVNGVPKAAILLGDITRALTWQKLIVEETPLGGQFADLFHVKA